MTSLVTSLSRFPICLTRFPISLPSFCSICKSTLHITFSWYTSNESALKNISFDVSIAWLWRHLICYKIVFWIYVTIFVRSSVFLLLLWVHDAFDFRLQVIKWIGIQSGFVWCAHYVVMTSFVTSQSHFLRYITWFSYGFLSSNFFYDRMLNVVSCYDTAN